MGETGRDQVTETVTGRMQIGEVAERTGLSLRTIRYYEEMELVVPSARTSGGFRLYTDADVERLRVIKRMKPLGFTLDEMRGLLETLKALKEQTHGEEEAAALTERLRGFWMVADARCDQLREQLMYASEFAEMLQRVLARQRLTGK